VRFPRTSLAAAGILALALAPAAQAGVVQSVGAELAKEGAKAAIAHFAPGLQHAIDPTAAVLSEIRAQLTELDQKISQLQQHQDALADRQLCATHVGTLRQIVSRARVSLGELIEATNLPDVTAREARLDQLWIGRGQLATDQDQLHTTLMDDAIVACGRSFESAMYPFLTSQLAPEVRDWYATYHAAGIALLTVRLNLYRYAGPTGTLKQVTTTNADGSTETRQVPVRHVLHSEAEAEALAKLVAGSGGWFDLEAAKIKPAVPYHLSYSKANDLVFRTSTYGVFGSTVDNLIREGWLVPASNSTIPTCSGWQAIANLTGKTGSAAVHDLRARNILDTGDGKIRCFDDHDNRYIYDLNAGSYTRLGYGNLFSGRAIACRRPGPGVFEVAQFSYGNK